MSSAGREELAGKTAVVTGASSGMGRGIAIAFSGAGADVVFTGRDLPGLEAAAAEARGNTHVLSILGDRRCARCLGGGGLPGLGRGPLHARREPRHRRGLDRRLTPRV